MNNFFFFHFSHKSGYHIFRKVTFFLKQNLFTLHGTHLEIQTAASFYLLRPPFMVPCSGYICMNALCSPVLTTYICLCYEKLVYVKTIAKVIQSRFLIRGSPHLWGLELCCRSWNYSELYLLLLFTLLKMFLDEHIIQKVIWL